MVLAGEYLDLGPRPDLRDEPGDQLTAVRGMVAGLAARLKTNPDDPEGWVRLVRAYAVLGETARREAALKDASLRYAKRYRPEFLPETLGGAAECPGIDPGTGVVEVERLVRCAWRESNPIAITPPIDIASSA